MQIREPEFRILIRIKLKLYCLMFSVLFFKRGRQHANKSMGIHKSRHLTRTCEQAADWFLTISLTSIITHHVWLLKWNNHWLTCIWPITAMDHQGLTLFLWRGSRESELWQWHLISCPFFCFWTFCVLWHKVAEENIIFFNDFLCQYILWWRQRRGVDHFHGK